MNKSTGFIKPLNKKEGFILYNEFHCIIPLDDTGVSEEVKKSLYEAEEGRCGC